MRIFNATKAALSFSLPNGQQVTIPGKSVSGDIMANADFLSMLVSSYTQDELAFIVGGPYELNICAGIPTVTTYVVQTLDEALQRFGLKEEKKAPVEEEVEEQETPVMEEVTKTEENLPEKPEPKKRGGGRKKKEEN